MGKKQKLMVFDENLVDHEIAQKHLLGIQCANYGHTEFA